MGPGTHPLIHVGFLAFFVVALVVGVRLLLLFGRTRQLPELLIGLGVLGIGPVGFGCLVVAQGMPRDSAGYAALVGAGSVAVLVGVVAKLIFNWRVYHPESALVRAAVGVCAALLALVFALDLADGFSHYRELNLRFLVRTPLQIGALLWGSAEALRYFGLMRRRARLGLGDAVVANRFLLWGIGAGAAGVGTLVGVVVQIASGQMHTQVPWVMASSSAHGFVAAVAMWLAFVPPPGYTRWVQAHSAR